MRILSVFGTTHGFWESLLVKRHATSKNLCKNKQIVLNMTKNWSKYSLTPAGDFSSIDFNGIGMIFHIKYP